MKGALGATLLFVAASVSAGSLEAQVVAPPADTVATEKIARYRVIEPSCSVSVSQRAAPTDRAITQSNASLAKNGPLRSHTALSGR